MAMARWSVSWKDYVDRLWDRHHAEHAHLAENIERERRHVGEEMGKLNELRQEVTADRGLLPTRADLSAVDAKLTAHLEQLDQAVEAVQGEQKAQRARTAAWLGAMTLGLTALTIFLSLVR